MNSKAANLFLHMEQSAAFSVIREGDCNKAAWLTDVVAQTEPKEAKKAVELLEKLTDCVLSVKRNCKYRISVIL